jgi:DNA-3-methyladenine glycosylase
VKFVFSTKLPSLPSSFGEQLPAPLARDFYQRSVLSVARDCVGKLLISLEGEVPLVARIVETEAYRGPEDRAAHSYGGRRTQRTEAMFGDAGHAYVFFVYGQHHHLNLVTGRTGEPHAVLVRALEPCSGLEQMAKNRNIPLGYELTNGPGKLCKAFGITLRHYRVDLTRGPLYLAAGSRGKLARSPRVGVRYAGAWAKKPWRFFEADNPWVSRPPRSALVSREEVM